MAGRCHFYCTQSAPQTKPPDISVVNVGSINMDKPSVTQFKARRSLRSRNPPSSYSSSAGSSSSQTSTTTMNYPSFDSLSGVRKRTLSSTFNDDDSIYGGGNKRLRRDSSFAGSASFDVSMVRTYLTGGFSTVIECIVGVDFFGEHVYNHVRFTALRLSSKPRIAQNLFNELSVFSEQLKERYACVLRSRGSIYDARTYQLSLPWAGHSKSGSNTSRVRLHN